MKSLFLTDVTLCFCVDSSCHSTPFSDLKFSLANDAEYRTQSFAKYDYGFLKNFQVYNSLFPPSYDVSSIPSIPLLLIHGGNDGLADVEDVSFLLQKLTFAPQAILLPDYGHMDFMIGNTANVDCYSKVLNFLAV